MTQALQDEIRKLLDRQGTTDPSFASIACRIVETFDVKIGVVYTLDPGTGMLKLRCHCGIPKDQAGKLRFLCMGKDIPGHVATSRKPLQGCHGVPSKSHEPEFEIYGIGTLFVPMMHEDALTGVLGIGKGFHHEYAPDEVERLTSLGNLIASYLK
jgi:signal transduction protein with GAF and PtsI domain